VALRRSEDERAAAVLGSTATWWPYLDAIYRDPKYDSWEQIAAENVEEHALVEELRQRCAALSEPILLFPLAVGHHVDHQVVFRAGWALQQTGRCVAFYEDLPYTAWKGGPQTRLAELAQVLHPQLVGTTESWPAKLEAVSAYASQLDALSHEGVSVLEFLDRYGASLLPGGRAERLWWPQEGVWI
jgi:LmbE family N-acetylglucosaminyl deacetylase